MINMIRPVPGSLQTYMKHLEWKSSVKRSEQEWQQRQGMESSDQLTSVGKEMLSKYVHIKQFNPLITLKAVARIENAA